VSSALTHLAGPLTYLIGLIVVAGLLFLLASFVFGRGERMAPMHPDVSPVVLPAARPASGRDVRRLRMSVVVRGYRMSEVDWILDQLAEQIDERDRELDRLRGLVDRRDGVGQPEADSPDSTADPDSSADAAGAADPAGADEPADGALAEEARHG
jgi:DivIVA domain-containing protein